MKKCILCGKEHVNGCDKSEWDGVLKQKFNVNCDESELPNYDLSNAVKSLADDIDKRLLKEQERQHVNKKRGRPRRA